MSLFMVLLAAVQQPPATVPPPPIAPGPIVVRSGREPAYLSRIYSARETVMAAADQPGGYLGRVAFSVRATGWDDGAWYLNSEEDYRDQRNLSVVLAPPIAREAVALFGGSEKDALQRKMVVATGQAKRVRIEIIDAGERPTGKYYYQTHLVVTSLNQLRVVDLN